MDERAPTERQARILEVIRDFTEERGYPPSVREIGERVGLSSSSTVQSHLRSLEKRGLIHRDPTKPRALITTGSASAAANAPIIPDFGVVPIVGKVAAGTPITATENLEGDFILPAEFARKDGTFILRVQGESMIGAAILDGDLVVAMVDGEATVKRFFRESGRVRLQPENATMAPMYPSDVTILGKVSAMFRRL